MIIFIKDAILWTIWKCNAAPVSRFLTEMSGGYFLSAVHCRGQIMTQLFRLIFNTQDWIQVSFFFIHKKVLVPKWMKNLLILNVITGIGGIKHTRTRCYWKIMSVRMVPVTLHPHTTPPLIIFLEQHALMCFITFILLPNYGQVC